MDDCNKVLLLHGVWMSGLEMSLLRRRLVRDGFQVDVFRYPSLRRTPRENAARLQRHIREAAYGCLHLVAHSLGGLVVLNLFHHFPAQPPGRVVLLGSPVRGSGVARAVAGRRWLRPLLGRSGEAGLLDGAPPWAGKRPLGIIAGTSGIGIGRLLGGLQGESDGVVAVSEALVGNAEDTRLLPCNHMGLLFDARVASDVSTFLRQGRFPP
ncbi:MAG: alpha/beta fold hydrolase [Sedimenticola sp.]|nr:alpha/beta fold hydrolase [Sedimenticola sp.]